MPEDIRYGIGVGYRYLATLRRAIRLASTILGFGLGGPGGTKRMLVKQARRRIRRPTAVMGEILPAQAPSVIAISVTRHHDFWRDNAIAESLFHDPGNFKHVRPRQLAPGVAALPVRQDVISARKHEEPTETPTGTTSRRSRQRWYGWLMTTSHQPQWLPAIPRSSRAIFEHPLSFQRSKPALSPAEQLAQHRTATVQSRAYEAHFPGPIDRFRLKAPDQIAFAPMPTACLDEATYSPSLHRFPPFARSASAEQFVSATQSATATQASPGHGRGGDLYVDADELGAWVVDHLERELASPRSGTVAVDTRITTSWGGSFVGI